MKSRLKIIKGIEMAPMVDIVFLLITYFLLNSTVGKNTMIRVDLPESVTSSVMSQDNLNIIIDNKNEIFLDSEKISLKDLTTRLKTAKKQNKTELKVMIKGDKNTDYQMIISVMDAVHASGITRFSLAADKNNLTTPESQ